MAPQPRTPAETGRQGLLRAFVIRHGETIWNQEGRLQGHTDVPLSANGREQAVRLARRFAREDLVGAWSSDMSRARETAEAICMPHGIEVVSTPELRETRLGEWEGLTHDDIVQRGWGADLEAYRRDPTTNPPPGSEALGAVWDRISAFMDRLSRGRQEGPIAIVGHGGSLRMALCWAIGAPPECARRFWLDNASVSLVEFDPVRTRLRLVNDTCHLYDQPKD